MLQRRSGLDIDCVPINTEYRRKFRLTVLALVRQRCGGLLQFPLPPAVFIFLTS